MKIGDNLLFLGSTSEPDSWYTDSTEKLSGSDVALTCVQPEPQQGVHRDAARRAWGVFGWLVAACLTVCLVSCGSRGAKDQDRASTRPVGSSEPSEQSGFLPLQHARAVLHSENGFESRARAVAAADQLALAVESLNSTAAPLSSTLSPPTPLSRASAPSASLLQPPEAPSSPSALIVARDVAAATATVGDIRRKCFRTFHQSIDAREAVVQYDAAAQAAARVFPQLACEAKIASLLLRAEMDLDLTATYLGLYEAHKAVKSQRCEVLYRDALHELYAYRPSAQQLAEIDRKAVQMQTDAQSMGADTVIQPPAVPGDGLGWKEARITQLQSFSSKEAARVVVRMTQPAMYDVGVLAAQRDRGPRVYVDFSKTLPDKGLRNVEGQGLVQRIRVGKRKEGTRVVVDLEQAATYKVFYLPEPFRVVIDLSTGSEQQVSQGLAQVPGNAKGGVNRGSGLLRLVQRVVLDPGHGGEDPGAIGPGGLQEKDVTLDIAHRAAPILSRELGIVTLLTRDDDRYVALEQRAARANAFGADLFVSIHCNAAVDAGSRGVQTYVLSEASDEASHRLAARENATSPGGVRELGQLMSRLQSYGVATQSRQFAALLQRATLASLADGYRGIVDGGVRSATFFVLMGAQMPAVLFESSFISNPDEEARLATAEYRQKIANSIANAVRAYREGRD